MKPEMTQITFEDLRTDTAAFLKTLWRTIPAAARRSEPDALLALDKYRGWIGKDPDAIVSAVAAWKPYTDALLRPVLPAVCEAALAVFLLHKPR